MTFKLATMHIKNITKQKEEEKNDGVTFFHLLDRQQQ